MRDPTKKKPLQVLIDRDLHARVKLYAYALGETITSVINSALVKELPHNEAGSSRSSTATATHDIEIGEARLLEERLRLAHANK